MIWRSFESEWVKMRRRRLWYGSYGAITAVVVLTTIVTIAGALHHPDARGDLTLAQLAHASGLSEGLTQSGVLLGAVSFSIAAFQFGDRKSTRLNSSHLGISYAVFCLKKKTRTQ